MAARGNDDGTRENAVVTDLFSKPQLQ